MTHPRRTDTPFMGKIYDISVPLCNSTLVYPGNPAIRIEPQQEVAKGGSSNVSSVALGSHSGTHVDAPRHFFDAGASVDHLPLDVLMGSATVLEFPDRVMVIGKSELQEQGIEGLDVEQRRRVLLKTRNSGFLTQETEFHTDYTFLAPDGAEHLVQLGTQLVGIDYLSIEQFRSGHHRTHRTLLEREVVIVEGLNLDGIRKGVYEFFCLPLRIEGGDGAPARVVLRELGS